jgi:hypothetical protein
MPQTHHSKRITWTEELLALVQDARQLTVPARERRRRSRQLLARLAARLRDVASLEDLAALDELLTDDHDDLTQLLETLATLHALLIESRVALRTKGHANDRRSHPNPAPPDAGPE